MNVAVLYSERTAECGAEFVSRNLETALKMLKSESGVTFFYVDPTGAAGSEYAGYDPNGAPVINEKAKAKFGCDGLKVSVTHNRNYIAASFAFCENGVDCESKDRRLSDGFAKRLGTDPKRAIEKWTKIEALSKLSGIGVLDLINDIDFCQYVKRKNVEFYHKTLGGDLFTVAYIKK